MRHAASKVLFAHWSDAKRGAASPDRNDLDPSVMGAALQDVFILGAEPGGTWVYRVAGTRLSGFANRELRGEAFARWWDPADRPNVSRMLDGIVSDDAPLVGGAYGTAGGQRYEFELVLLPLRHGGRSGLRMIGGLFPSPATARRLGLEVEAIGLVSIRSLAGHAADAPVFGRMMPDAAAPLHRRRAFRVIDGGATR
jgi:hypothetical protein